MGFFPSEIKIQTICDVLFKIRSYLIFQYERRLFGRKRYTVTAYSVTVASQSFRYVSFVVCFFFCFCDWLCQLARVCEHPQKQSDVISENTGSFWSDSFEPSPSKISALESSDKELYHVKSILRPQLILIIVICYK